MQGLNFVNFGDMFGRWSLKKVVEVSTKVDEWADKHGLKDKNVYLTEVEDNSWEPREKNGRIDVRIAFDGPNGQIYEQKLLIMNGEVIDGAEFHKRINEFYPDKEDGKNGR